MSVSIKLYTFSKRKNSTEQPTGGTSYSCFMKDPCSIINPRIVLSISNPSSYNYAYIASFNRYYFITDWVSDHDMWIADLTVDVLASWKANITSSAQYVTRSGSSSDSYIVDGKYAITTDMDISNIPLDSTYPDPDHPDQVLHFARPFLRDVNNFKYIIATTNGADQSSGNPQKIGGASYYCLTPGEALMFMGYLLSEPTYMTLNVDEISDSLAKGLINPIQYISECYILPYQPQESLITGSMWCGWWPVDVSYAYPCLPRNTELHKWKIWESSSITIPSHPQTQSVGVFVNASGYTNVTLFAGIFGQIPIDPMLTAKFPTWKCEVYGDFKGRAELDVLFYDNTSSSWVFWNRYYAETSIPIGLSQLTSDGIKAVTGLVSSTIGVASGLIGGDPLKILSNIGGGIGSVVGVMNPHQAGQSKGASVAYLCDDWFVQTEHHLITDTSEGLLGAPLCQEVLLSTLSGYCLCENPSLKCPATSSELTEILTYMSSGFFLE